MNIRRLIATAVATASTLVVSAEMAGKPSMAGELDYVLRGAPTPLNGKAARVASRANPKYSHFPRCPYSRQYAPVLLSFPRAGVKLQVLPDGHTIAAENLHGQRLWTHDASEFDQVRAPPPFADGHTATTSLKICPVINILRVEKSPDYARLGQLNGGRGEIYVVWIYTSSATAWEIGLRSGVLLESERK